ncbi:MAG: hypothetical protein GPJ54_12540 [Candidatus Heimdallarchaeota archaeon]|nr:hypothetical protein [Candidatus Heimdallarchaeota archaeon]
MRLFSPKLLIFVLLLSSYTVFAQNEGPNRIIGVNEGQTYDYVITNKFGLEGTLFSDGFNNMTLEEGDTFKMTIIDSNPSIGETIELQLSNSEVNVSYTNELAFFDFVIYKDWEFWSTLLTTLSFDYYLDDDLFSFAYSLEDTDNGVFVYLEYSYDVILGINTHQLVYVAPINDPQNAISFIQIDLGTTAMPRPDLENIGFRAGEFYQYEVLQVSGFDDNSVIEGLNGGISFENGDKFLVSPLGDSPGGTDSVLTSIQSANNGIIYQNRLDFLNSINSPAFFIYHDWDYIETLVDRFIDDREEGVSITYEFTAEEFIYEEVNTQSIGYSLELIYDLNSGVLTFESYIQENTILNTVKIIEFTLRDKIEIDKTTLNFDIKGEYEYELTTYDPVSNADPLFQTQDDSLFVFEGDKFTITPQTGPDNDNLVPVRIWSDDESLIIFNQLDGLGSFFIYADWDYWTTVIELLQEFSVEGLEITFVNNDDTFTVHRVIDITGFQSNELMIYDKDTGVLLEYSFSASGIDGNGDPASFIIEFELTGSPDGGSNKDDSPGFLLPLGVLTLFITVITRRKFRK